MGKALEFLRCFSSITYIYDTCSYGWVERKQPILLGMDANTTPTTPTTLVYFHTRYGKHSDRDAILSPATIVYITLRTRVGIYADAASAISIWLRTERSDRPRYHDDSVLSAYCSLCRSTVLSPTYTHWYAGEPSDKIRCSIRST